MDYCSKKRDLISYDILDIEQIEGSLGSQMGGRYAALMITPHQIRAARALLGISQLQLAELALVSVATIRRFELGTPVGRLQQDALRRAVENAGAILINDGDELNSRKVGQGVALIYRNL